VLADLARQVAGASVELTAGYPLRTPIKKANCGQRDSGRCIFMSAMRAFA